MKYHDPKHILRDDAEPGCSVIFILVGNHLRRDHLLVLCTNSGVMEDDGDHPQLGTGVFLAHTGCFLKKYSVVTWVDPK